MTPMRSLEIHRDAEKYADQGDAYAHAHDDGKAATCYVIAGLLESLALELTPPSRPRTRSILAVSAVSLLAKSGKPDDAAEIARQLVKDERLQPWAIKALDEVVPGWAQ